MKKLGWLLCLVLGLTACGQAESQQKEEVFATLEEAIADHIAEDIWSGAEVEEIVQTRGAAVVLFSTSNEVQEEEPTVYFALFEETEDGFVFRDMTQGYSLGTWGQIRISNETGWLEEEGFDSVRYELTERGFGDTKPAEEELETGEKVYERDGFYFAVKMEVEEIQGAESGFREYMERDGMYFAVKLERYEMQPVLTDEVQIQ